MQTQTIETHDSPKVKRHRGATRNADSKPVTIWIPKTWIPLLDQAVKASDSDRSKFARIAIREKLAI